MKEESTLYSVSPDAYAEYLEQLNDTDFWNHAFEKAFMPRSPHAAHALATIAPQSDETLTCITCELRTARCVFPLPLIREILPAPQHITLLPDVPFWMLGILSWRGETIAAIDLCACLSKSRTPPLQNCIALIAEHEQMRLALCVRSINSTSIVVDTHHTTPFTQLTGEGKPSTSVAGVLMQEGMTQEPVLLLDIPALFDDVVRSIERRDV